MKRCPVLGCLRERRGIMCGEHWHMLPRWAKVQLRDGVDHTRLKVAIAVAIEQEQALRDVIWQPIEVPEFTPSQGTSHEISRPTPL